MRLGCGKGVPDPRSQPVLLQYSLNGGLSWSLLQEFLFSNSSNVGRYIALEIPLKARSTSTRLRWWQPSENGHFYSPWVIDQVSSLRINYCNVWHLSCMWPTEHPVSRPPPPCSVEEAQDQQLNDLPKSIQLD